MRLLIFLNIVRLIVLPPIAKMTAVVVVMR